MSRNRFLTFLAVALGALGCGAGLPANFDHLTLEKQVDAYGRYLKDHVNPQESARQSIASHGGEAARLMAGVLRDERSGFPSLEAIRIIDSVQSEVCSLRATAVPQALKEFLARPGISQAEYSWARTTLDEIGADSSRPLCQ